MKIFMFIYLISLSLLLCSSCRSGEANKDPDANSTERGTITISPEQFKIGGMALGSIEEMELPEVVTSIGIIDVPPANRALVSAYQAGYIKNTPLLVGDQVQAGQVVVTLEHPEFVKLQQQYLEISGQLTFLKAEYERQQALLEAQVTSRKNFLKAESDYNTAMATFNGLAKTLQILNINPQLVEKGQVSSVVPVLAPIGGRITRMNVSKGKYVSPSDPILEIINRDHIHLELAVFEKDIMKVREGQRIRFAIPEASNTWFDASVYLVGTALEESGRTVKVHGHLEGEPPPGLAIGMYVEAEIITASAMASVLPEEAIIHREDGDYVCLLRGQEKEQYLFELVKIQKGTNSGGFTTIANPEVFPEEARFLTRGAYSLFGEE
jgi:cobalt-zinc-cadmium efflux system membrane fusion protein